MHLNHTKRLQVRYFKSYCFDISYIGSEKLFEVNL